MTWNDHDHRGQYAEDRHDHDGDYAALHHRHYDLEREDDRLQGALREIDTQLSDLRRELSDALERIRRLEAEHEADVQREGWELRQAAERDREVLYGPPGAEEDR
jgi:chromosome segregation ATPase